MMGRLVEEVASVRSPAYLRSLVVGEGRATEVEEVASVRSPAYPRSLVVGEGRATEAEAWPVLD
jgi:hypothetical protein